MGKREKKLLLSLLLEICFLFVFVDCTYGLRVHFLSGKKEIVFLPNEEKEKSKYADGNNNNDTPKKRKCQSSCVPRTTSTTTSQSYRRAKKNKNHRKPKVFFS